MSKGHSQTKAKQNPDHPAMKRKCTPWFLESSMLKAKKESNLPDMAQRLCSDNIDELLSLFEKSLTREQFYLVEHLRELLDATDEDEKIEVSVGSLKSMMLFFLELKIFRKPTSIALNENGTFQLRWKQDDSYLTTLRFQENNHVDYLVFLPSKYEKEPIVLNGNMNLFDFEELFVRRCGLTTKLLRG
ncbi:MAG: hypothetical protein R3E08_02075 [Thiotrichaceae bacterium]